MTINRIMAFIFALSLLGIAGAEAQEPANLQEAKALSAQTGKPLLMEFVRRG